MATDNTPLPAVTGKAATRDVTYSGEAAHVQAVGIVGFSGADDAKVATDIPGDATNGLDVDVTRLPTLPAGDNNIGNVDIVTVPAPLNLTGGGVELGALRVTLANDSTGVLSVDDNGGSLTVDGTVAATQSGTWNITNISGTVSLPTGAATETTLSALNVKTPALGQATMANSVPVTLASNQGAVPVSGTFWQATQPVSVSGAVAVTDNSGSITVDDGGGSLTVDGSVTVSGTVTVVDGAGSLTVDNAGTFAVQAAQSGGWSVSISGTPTVDTELPTAAALADNAGNPTAPAVGAFNMVYDRATWDRAPGTAADGLLVNLGANNDVVVSDGGGSITVDGTVAISGSVPVTGTFWQATQPISAASLPLPSGAATETTLAAISTKTPALGQALMTASSPVVIASNQSSIPVTDNGGSLTVDGTVSVSGTVAVTDNSGSLTVDNAGTFAVQAAQSGTWNITNVSGTVSLPTGASTETTLAAVKTAVELVDDTVVADNAAFADSTTKLSMGGFIYDEVAGTALSENDAAAARINANRAQIGVLEDGATRGRLATVTASNALKVDGSAVTQPVSDGGGSLTVDGTVGVSGSVAVTGTFWQATQPVSLASLPALAAGTANIGDVDVLSVPAPLNVTGGGVEAGALRVTIASDSTGVVSVDDNGSSLTVDGTITANQGGTWNITNVSGTVSLPSGASTSANQSTIITAVQLLDDVIVTDNAAFSDGTTKLSMGGFIYDEVAGTALTENDAAAARINVNRAQVHAIEDGVTRGRYVTVSAANALKVDGSAVTQPVSGTFWQATQPISAASLPLPSGAATETTLAALNTKHPAQGQATMAASVPVAIASNQSAVPVSGTFWQATQPVSIAASVSVTDGGGSLTVDGTVGVSGTVTVDTELPAAAILADNTSNPTVPGVAAFNMAFDGTTWDRMPGTSADGLLVNLGANNDVTVTNAVAVTGTFWQATQPVSLASVPSHAVTNAGTFAVQAAQSGTWSVTDGGGSLTVDGTVGVSGTVAVTDNAGSLTVDDGGLSLTVDGTVSANQSGTWNVGLSAGSNNIGDVDVLTLPPATPLSSSGSITGVNQSVTLTLAGRTAVGFQLTGTWSGTIEFQISNDNVGWVAVVPSKVGTLGFVTSFTTTSGIYLLSTAGFAYARVTSTGWSSGTCSVYYVASEAAGIVGNVPVKVDSTNSSISVSNAPLAVTGEGTNVGALRVALANDHAYALPVELPADYTGSPASWLNVRLVTGSSWINMAPMEVTGGGTEAGALRVTLANNSTGVLSVDDNGGTLSIDDGGGSITVDGTVAVTGTFWQATQPVSIASSVPVTDNAGSLTVDAPVGTPVYVRLSDGASAITTLPVSLASVPSHAVTDGGGSLTVDGSVSVSGTVDTELPTAAALADNTANPTAPAVGSFGHVWDGATWDRAPGNSTDGMLVNLGANNDVTVTGSVSISGTPTVSGSGTFIVGDGGAAISVDDNGSSLTVDNSGTFAVQAAQSGTWNIGTVTTLTGITNALPAGTNAIGKLAANSGVDIGDVDILSVVPGTGATNLGKAEDAAHTTGDVGVMALAVVDGGGGVVAGDYAALNVTTEGILRTESRADRKVLDATSSGLTISTTAYANLDQVGAQFTFANAARVSGGGGLITGVTLIDAADVIGPCDLFIYESSVTPASDNAAFSVSDADSNKLIHVIQLSSPFDMGANRAIQASNLAISYVCAGGTSLYGLLMTRSANSFFAAATDIKIRVFVERD